jgi:predicted ATP-grasp superfamily ATP-dependent carboligase
VDVRDEKKEAEGEGTFPVLRPRGSGAVARTTLTVERRRRVAVAYDVTSSSPMDLVAAIGHLFDIVWVVDLDHPSLGSFSRLLHRLGSVIDTHSEAPQVIAERLRDSAVDGVVAFTDGQLELASALAESLGLAHNPAPVVDCLRDKHLQRERLASAGIAVPGFRRIACPTTPDQVAEAVNGLVFPLVVKPLRGHSSRRVQVVADVAALKDLFASGVPGAAQEADDYIAEEYLAGDVVADRQGVADYVSVESIIQAGVAVPVALTGKFPLMAPFRESGNFMPHPLSSEEAASVLDLSVAVARALGVRCGALHTEVKLTPDGPRVIEVNGRVGGGGIDSIFAKTHGTSLSELAVRVACDEKFELVAESPQSWSGPFTYAYFVQPPMSARRLCSIGGANELIGIEGVDSALPNKAPGDELCWEQGSQGYLVQVNGKAEDRAALRELPGLVAETLEVDFD